MSHVDRLGAESTRLRVAWISDFPVEWLTDLPEELRSLPRLHPFTWQRVLAAELETRPGLELHICSLRKHATRSLDFERRGVHYHVLKTPPFLRAPSFFWLDTLLIRRALRRVQPDLVHAWGTEKGASLVASRLVWPSLTTVQGILGQLRQSMPLQPYHRAMTVVERISLRRHRFVTTSSGSGARFLAERYPHLVVQRIEHVPHRVFHDAVRRPVTGPLRFLSSGTFTYNKGADLIIQALDRLRSTLGFELVVVGHTSPAYLAQLKRNSSPEIWKRVRLRQEVDIQEVAAELAQATLMLFASRGENSPNAVKEAVVVGVPVVASRVGSVPEYIQPGKNGVLCDAGSLESFTQALLEAARDPLLSRGEVCPDTHRAMRALLNPAVMADRYWETYQQVLAAGTSRRGTSPSP